MGNTQAETACVLYAAAGRVVRPSHTYEQSLINLKVREAGWKVFALSREIHWQWWSDRGRGLDKRGQFLHFSG
ncbi:MAG: hypothetical protein MUF18_08650, partial [Fimbriiglobus sp.]|nr:hypothetical protein [Fimbriiglobus sp.]